MTSASRPAGFKYNPGFADDNELRESFVVRKRELRLLLQIIVENSRSSNNRHILLIGPRGAGKTTLARRIAAEIRDDDRLNHAWLPISFGEESYTITSTGEFWLEAVYHLQETVHSDELAATHAVLRRVADEAALLDSALGALIEYAQAVGKRLILIVENLNSLLENQMSGDDAWSFRHALQNHPQIMLLATATASFDQIERDELALFEQFKVHHVGPLSATDCRKLWTHVANERLNNEQIRPIQILTGGNPRLIRVLAEFARDNVFANLLNNLAMMIDQYTDYFKSQLDLLPSSERKVFVAVLENWDPVQTSQVADTARVTVSQASAFLSRLERRGAITKSGRHWQASERLFNIYYLMRRRGTPSSRVHALVKFMTVYYAPDQLVKQVSELANQACDLKPSDRLDHYYAISSLMVQLAPGEQRQALAQWPSTFFQDPNLPSPLARLRATLENNAPPAKDRRRNPASSTSGLRDAVFKALANDDVEAASTAIEALRAETGDTADTLVIIAMFNSMQNNPKVAEAACEKVLTLEPEHAPAWMLLAGIYSASGRIQEGLVAARRFAELRPDVAHAWELLARVSLDAKLGSREVRPAFEKALALEPKSVPSLLGLADLAKSEGDARAAEVLLKRAVAVRPPNLAAFGEYSDFLTNAGRVDEAERLYRKMIRKFPTEARVWTRLAILVQADAERQEEARSLFEKSLTLAKDEAQVFFAAAEFYDNVGEYDTSEKHWQRALELDPMSSTLWLCYAAFAASNGRSSDAERAYLKAIEIEPDAGRPWEMLGSFLSEKSERQAEAENALREAIAKNPESCSPYHSLGALFERQGRYNEADAEYRRALAVRPSCGCALESLISARTSYGANVDGIAALIDGLVEAHPTRARALGLRARYYWRAMGDRAAARAELLAAIRLERGVSSVWSDLTAILLEESGSSDDVLDALFDLISEHRPCVHVLNDVARSLAREGTAAALKSAAAVAQHALNKKPDDWDVRYTLANIQLDIEHFAEAISHFPKLIDEHKEIDFHELLALSVRYLSAAKGREAQLLHEAEQAERISEMEPFTVAIRMKMGEDIHVATEVREVALDILETVGKVDHAKKAGAVTPFLNSHA